MLTHFIRKFQAGNISAKLGRYTVVVPDKRPALYVREQYAFIKYIFIFFYRSVLQRFLQPDSHIKILLQQQLCVAVYLCLLIVSNIVCSVTSLIVVPLCTIKTYLLSLCWILYWRTVQETLVVAQQLAGIWNRFNHQHAGTENRHKKSCMSCFQWRYILMLESSAKSSVAWLYHHWFCRHVIIISTCPKLVC